MPVLLIAFLTSCNRNEGEEITSIDPVKIDSIKVPRDSVFVGSVLPIRTFSVYQSQCEGFYGYDYQHTDSFQRTVAAYKFRTNAQCEGNLVRASQINFQPQQTGVYHFRFWNGKSGSGEDLWIEKEIKVYE